MQQLCPGNSLLIEKDWNVVIYAFVGASHGNLPHDENFGDQVTLTQIGIQATLR
jgi:hypothetical protein